MKRILSLILILILSLGVLSACQLFPTPSTTTPTQPTTPPANTYNPEAARDYVRGMYTDFLDNNQTKRDFKLIASLMFFGDKYTVEWTVDTDLITVVPADDGIEVTVDVPDSVESDLNYKLTGNVLAPDGTSAVLEFDLVVPAPEVEPVLDMMGNTNNVSISTTQAVFQANGVTFTNDKASSTTDVKLYDYAYRAYAGSTVKIEYPGMRKIVITVDDYDGNGKTYMAGFDGMVVEGATIIRKHDVITILFLDGAVDVFQSTNLASQTRIEKIEVFTSLTAEDIAMGEAANGGNGGETSEYQAPAANTAFKWFMEIGGLNYYFAGSMSGDYLATTTDVAAAADIYFEVVDGGYHIYFMNSETKTYINAAGYKKSNGYLGCHFSVGTEPSCVWTYNDTFGILEVAAEFEGLDPDTFFAGTYGSYTTVSLSGSYYKAQITSGTQFPARLVLSSEAGNTPVHTHKFVDGKCECGEMDPNYVPPVTEGLQIVTAPQVGVAYKFGLYHGNESQNVFFNGENYNNYAWYFAYTPVVAEAMDVYLETVEGVEGGYRLYFNKDGVKTYIVAFPRDGDTTKGTLKFDTAVPAEYFTFSAEHNTLIYTSTTGEQFYIGSSGTYKSISLSAISYITNATSYISHLYGEGNGSQGGETPAPHEHNYVDGKCSCGATDPNYVPPVNDGPTVVKTPAVDTAYKFGMLQGNLNKMYYLAGGMDGYYMATTTDYNAALDFYLESTEGGYYLYCYVNNVKTYVNFVVSGTHVNGAYETTANSVFKFNATGLLVTTVNDTEYGFGTYNTFTTLGPNKTSYTTNFFAEFYTLGTVEGGEVTPPAHEHTFVEGKCECGEEDPTYVPPVEGGDEVVSGGSADFDTLLPGSNGDSSYTKTHTTTDGWVIANSAIQAGGATVINPQFPVIGADNSSKAVCLNGKTTGVGKVTSPTLKGGISKLTMNYTKMFTDTKLSVTITVTDLATGAVYTHVVEREEAKDTKYVVWTDEWVLDTAIEGDFTIEIVNNCPSASTSNKDRITILDLSWTK